VNIASGREGKPGQSERYEKSFICWMFNSMHINTQTLNKVGQPRAYSFIFYLKRHSHVICGIFNISGIQGENNKAKPVPLHAAKALGGERGYSSYSYPT
jgi:hypothetical protein